MNAYFFCKQINFIKNEKNKYLKAIIDLNNCIKKLDNFNLKYVEILRELHKKNKILEVDISEFEFQLYYFLLLWLWWVHYLISFSFIIVKMVNNAFFTNLRELSDIPCNCIAFSGIWYYEVMGLLCKTPF